MEKQKNITPGAVAHSESEQTIRALLDSSDDVILFVDLAGNFITLNELTARRLGSTVEQMIGKNMADFMPAELAATRIKLILDIVASGKNGAFVDRGTDGRWFDNRIYLVRGASGEVEKVAVFARDITDRIRAEEALRESETRYRALFEFAPATVIIVGTDGTIRDINRTGMEESLYSISGESAIGKNFLELGILAGADAEHLSGIQHALMRGENAKEVEITLPGCDGRKRRAKLFISPLMKDGEVYAIQVISLDVTELHETREALRALTRSLISLQEDERARVSRDIHDHIGRFLTAMGLELDLMAKNMQTGPENITRLSGLTAAATEEMRRICRGLRPATIDRMGLSPSLAALASEFEKLTDFDVTTDIDDILAGELTPEAAICCYRVLQEALNNAQKHSDGRKIAISLKRGHENILTLKVKDDGRGFIPGQGRAGAGLGLIGMHERAALCGGNLSLISAPGFGTSITMRVPINSAPERKPDDSDSACG